MSPLSAGLSDLPFMVMPHPLLPVSLPPASVAMAMNQMSHLSDLANMAAVSQAQTEESKVRLAGKNSTANATSANAIAANATRANYQS